MRRFAATVLCDIRLQMRNGFYYAAAFVAAFWIFVLWQLGPDTVAWLMPLFILSNLQINTFYFVAGLVLLEKGEGTLLAQAITPLRKWEYLGSKAITLTLLSVIENFIIVAIVFGLQFRLLPLVSGMAAGALMFVFTGLILASRYDSISEYLFPSFLYTLAFAPPFLSYAGIWSSAISFAHPLQAALVLIQAAFQDVSHWYWVYGVTYSAVWVAVFLWYSRRAFLGFLVATEGTR